MSPSFLGSLYNMFWAHLYFPCSSRIQPFSKEHGFLSVENVPRDEDLRAYSVHAAGVTLLSECPEWESSDYLCCSFGNGAV